MIDDQGRKFSTSNEMGASASLESRYGIESTMGVQPTQAVLQAELFDVPADAVITKVVFEGQFGGDEVTVAAA